MTNTASTGAAPAVDPAHITQAARDTLNVRRVFGEPYERGGALVIPVATVWGGTGSGWGSGELAGSGGHGRRGRRGEAGDAAAEQHASDSPGTGEGSGGGGGFGVRVKATGVYVVDDAGARWQPALDLNRVILGGQVLAAVVTVAVTLAWAVTRRRR